MPNADEIQFHILVYRFLNYATSRVHRLIKNRSVPKSFKVFVEIAIFFVNSFFFVLYKNILLPHRKVYNNGRGAKIYRFVEKRPDFVQVKQVLHQKLGQGIVNTDTEHFLVRRAKKKMVSRELSFTKGINFFFYISTFYFSCWNRFTYSRQVSSNNLAGTRYYTGLWASASTASSSTTLQMLDGSACWINVYITRRQCRSRVSSGHKDGNAGGRMEGRGVLYESDQHQQQFLPCPNRYFGW